MNLPHLIPFTRFHLPDGRQTKESISVDDETFAQYKKVAEAGLRMTVEILTTGQISQAIEAPGLGDFDLIVCPNEPGAPRIALKTMLMRFDPSKVPAWKQEMQ